MSLIADASKSLIVASCCTGKRHDASIGGGHSGLNRER